MGGQACVLYGAAEFSRDTDLAILASPPNLSRLRAALNDLEAEVIAVPPFEREYLIRGHAIHFRCRITEAAGTRVDVMTKMRGLDPFPKLWARRSTVTLADGMAVEVMALEDLVRAKKTQRDKDWPMLRRLLEAHYFGHHERPRPSQVAFWMRELRTPELLIEAAGRWPTACARWGRDRPLLALAAAEDQAGLAAALEQAEREVDRSYWQPLKAELERLRRGKRRRPKPG